MTTKIDRFNREHCGELSDAIEAALQDVAAKYGVEITRGNARYTADNMTLKIDASVINADGVTVTKDAAEFLTSCDRNNGLSIHGLTADDLHAEFADPQRPGLSYRIVGYRPRCYAAPIVAECVGGSRKGKTYRFPIAFVVANMAGRS